MACILHSFFPMKRREQAETCLRTTLLLVALLLRPPLDALGSPVSLGPSTGELPSAAGHSLEQASPLPQQDAQESHATDGSTSWQIDLESFANHPRVLHYLKYFQGPGREHMTRSIHRGAPYVGMIQDRLKEANLPLDLVNLALIESGFSNTAVSRVGATGMWQFMPSTARAYGLRVDDLVDERRDPYKATDAAILHLRDLTEQFQSPYLAAAAYNAGAESITRGLELLPSDQGSGSRRDGADAGGLGSPGMRTDRSEEPIYPGDVDFFRLSEASLLASETSNYVPKLIAASIMARDPARYRFAVPSITPPDLDSVVVTKATRLKEVARIVDLPERMLRQLNPQYVRGITPSGTRSVIRLPKKADTDLAALQALCVPHQSEGERSSKRSGSPKEESCANQLRLGAKTPKSGHLIVRRGDTVKSIAKRHRISEETLRRINVLPEWYELRPGQILQLPKSHAAEGSS